MKINLKNVNVKGNALIGLGFGVAVTCGFYLINKQYLKDMIKLNEEYIVEKEQRVNKNISRLEENVIEQVDIVNNEEE